MVGYLTKVKVGYMLTVCRKPCNGEEYANSPKYPIADKKQANGFCKENKIEPYNF